MHDAVSDPPKESRTPHTRPEGSAESLPDQESINLALQAGEVGIWSWGIKSNRIQWSGNLARIHGIRAEDFDGTFAAFQKDIHPEDVQEVLSAIQESVRTRKPYHAHYRLAPRDNRDERWLESMAAVIDEGGEAVRMVGICRDVLQRGSG